MIEQTISRASKEVLLDVPYQISKHRLGMTLALSDIGQEVVNETARLIKTGARTGRVYRFRGRKHESSSPDEVPASRTGRLAKSGAYKVRSYSEMTVGEKAPYAGYLEGGTRRMAPRPHLITAINNKARDTQNSLIEHGKRQIGIR